MEFHGIPWKVVTDIQNTWSDLCFDDVIMMSYPVPFCTFEDVSWQPCFEKQQLESVTTVYK